MRKLFTLIVIVCSVDLCAASVEEDDCVFSSVAAGGTIQSSSGRSIIPTWKVAGSATDKENARIAAEREIIKVEAAWAAKPEDIVLQEAKRAYKNREYETAEKRFAQALKRWDMKMIPVNLLRAWSMAAFLSGDMAKADALFKHAESAPPRADHADVLARDILPGL